jgi:hypothetical protein
LTKKKTVSAVHVWYDYRSSADGQSTYYSVSTVDAQNDEVRCEDGSSDFEEAWKSGVELATDEGVSCFALDEHERIFKTFDPLMSRRVPIYFATEATKANVREWLASYGCEQQFDALIPAMELLTGSEGPVSLMIVDGIAQLGYKHGHEHQLCLGRSDFEKRLPLGFVVQHVCPAADWTGYKYAPDMDDEGGSVVVFREMDDAVADIRRRGTAFCVGVDTLPQGARSDVCPSNVMYGCESAWVVNYGDGDEDFGYLIIVRAATVYEHHWENDAFTVADSEFAYAPD